ncbi:hypothetical protein FRB91_000913 [Serendipita sp. 411]|nr:hypothetical protein FRB91_000913 [Serendipita sp. 411]
MKRKDRLLDIYRHPKTDEDEDEKGTVDRERAPAITTLNLKASLGAKWYEFKSRVEEMRKAREEGHDDAVQVEKVE